MALKPILKNLQSADYTEEEQKLINQHNQNNLGYGLNSLNRPTEHYFKYESNSDATKPPETPQYGFTPSQTYLDAMKYTQSLLDKLNAGRTSYTDKINDIMGQIENRKPFAYDFNTDPLFQQQLQSAMRSGKLAMQDTMGQASALTGGYGSTYGQAVGNQAYNQSVSEAYDSLPDYYGLAYNAWQDETNGLYNQLGMYQNADDTEFSRLANAYALNMQNAANMYDQEYNNYWQNKQYLLDYAKQFSSNSSNEEETDSFDISGIIKSVRSDIDRALKNGASEYDIMEIIASSANEIEDEAMAEKFMADAISYMNTGDKSAYVTSYKLNREGKYEDGKGHVIDEVPVFTVVKGEPKKTGTIYTDQYDNEYTYEALKSNGWTKYIKAKESTKPKHDK